MCRMSPRQSRLWPTSSSTCSDCPAMNTSHVIKTCTELELDCCSDSGSCSASGDSTPCPRFVGFVPLVGRQTTCPCGGFAISIFHGDAIPLFFATQINLRHEFKMSAFGHTHVLSCVCHLSVDANGQLLLKISWSDGRLVGCCDTRNVGDGCQ